MTFTRKNVEDFHSIACERVFRLIQSLKVNEPDIDHDLNKPQIRVNKCRQVEKFPPSRVLFIDTSFQVAKE